MTNNRYNAAKLQALKTEVDNGWRRARELSSALDFARDKIGRIETERRRHPVAKIPEDRRVRAEDSLLRQWSEINRRLADARRERNQLQAEQDRITEAQRGRAALLNRCLEALQARGIVPDLLDDRPHDPVHRRADIETFTR